MTVITTKSECKICGTTKGVKFYVIADDMENPQPYCKKCWKEFTYECLLRLCEEKNK